jgi:hypothetical protein
MLAPGGEMNSAVVPAVVADPLVTACVPPTPVVRAIGAVRESENAFNGSLTRRHGSVRANCSLPRRTALIGGPMTLTKVRQLHVAMEWISGSGIDHPTPRHAHTLGVVAHFETRISPFKRRLRSACPTALPTSFTTRSTVVAFQRQ